MFGADVTLPEQPTPPDRAAEPSIPSAKTSGNFNGAALAGFRVERARVSIDARFCGPTCPAPSRRRAST